MEYFEESNQLEAISIYKHDAQVWALDTSPKDPTLFMTSGVSQNGTKTLNLFSINENHPDTTETNFGFNLEPKELIPKAILGMRETQTFVDNIKFHPKNDHVLTADHKFLNLW